MNMKPVPKCYGCENRTVGCQADCPSYKQFKKDLKEYRDNIVSRKNGARLKKGPVKVKATYMGEVRYQDDLVSVTFDGIRRNGSDITISCDINEMLLRLESAVRALKVINPREGARFSGTVTCKSVKRTDDGYRCAFTNGETQYIGTTEKAPLVSGKVILKGDISKESLIISLKNCEVKNM